MKHYTERVRKGILAIEANMEIYASDKRDEGDKEEAAAVEAALTWIRDKERQARAKAGHELSTRPGQK